MPEPSGVRDMTIKITVKNLTNGSTIRVEVESSDTISEIIESAAEFWKLKEGAYVLTNDKELRRRLRKENVPLIYLRSGRHLVVDDYLVQ